MELADSGPDVLDRHFTYQAVIELNYAERDKDPAALAAAIAGCENQISIAANAAIAFKHMYRGSRLPSHKGFEQLAIVREKQKNYAEAIRIAKEALSQGWAGDWEKRIVRCKNKLAR